MRDLSTGAAVRITAERLGCLTDPDDSRFCDEVLCRGDVATFVGRHPNEELADAGWDMLLFVRGGVSLWCPVHDSHYEPHVPSVAIRLGS